MRQFCQLDDFDCVINMFTAFGYFEDPADDKRVLLNAYSSLRKGGSLIIDVLGKEKLARIFQSRDWHEEDGKLFLQERRICNDWSWVENRWLVIEDGKQQEFKFGHRIYSAVELTGLLRECGFSSVNVYGNFDGADYDEKAERLIAVAKK
jgi:SAM-dependent methyltransferase